MPKKIVAFGELLMSLCPPGYNRFVQAETFTTRYTGAEANTAVSLVQFGMEAYAVSKVPTHEMGQACINYLRRFGLNTDYVVRGGDRLGLLFLETGASQRASKVIYDRAHSSFAEAKPDDFDWPAILKDKQWLHFSGTAPALGANIVQILKEALGQAHASGVTVSCDCNYRSKLWSAADAGRTLGDLLTSVDVFIGGKEDAEKLFGIRGAEEEAARQLRERFGFRCVAMTLRGGVSASVNRLGGLVCDASGVYTSRSYEMQIVDRVGGGDAFTAGLIYGLLSDFEPQQTVEFAAAASCLKHSILGDFNLVSLDEVEQLLAGDQSGRVQR